MLLLLLLQGRGRVMAYVASRRITLPLPLLLRYRRVMAYVASRRIILFLPLLLLLLPAWLQYRAAPNTRDC